MFKIANHPTYQHYYHSSVNLARAGLRKSCLLPEGSDPELIRSALLSLSGEGHITRYRDLVTLRWATILLDQLPEDHPERRALYQAWYQMKDRVKEEI